jgi:hypothetical protein
MCHDHSRGVLLNSRDNEGRWLRRHDCGLMWVRSKRLEDLSSRYAKCKCTIADEDKKKEIDVGKRNTAKERRNYVVLSMRWRWVLPYLSVVAIPNSLSKQQGSEAIFNIRNHARTYEETGFKARCQTYISSPYSCKVTSSLLIDFLSPQDRPPTIQHQTQTPPIRE